MSEPFVAEIRMFAGNFAPRNYAFCSGQLFPISQNTALFSLLGTTYGGDGESTFALPNLDGRAPMHPGNGPGLSNRRLGERGGNASITLTSAEMAPHSHGLRAAPDPADLQAPGPNRALARSSGNAYAQPTALVPMADSLQSSGGGQPHNNLQPYIAVNFIIALFGIFPPRN